MTNTFDGLFDLQNEETPIEDSQNNINFLYSIWVKSRLSKVESFDKKSIAEKLPENFAKLKGNKRNSLKLPNVLKSSEKKENPEENHKPIPKRASVINKRVSLIVPQHSDESEAKSKKIRRQTIGILVQGNVAKIELMFPESLSVEKKKFGNKVWKIF